MLGDIIIAGGPIFIDDDDDEGIPPEILDLMRLTEAMASGGGLFGGALNAPVIREIPIENFGAPRELVERHEESHDDIMAKMEALSKEVGERTKRTKKQSHQGMRVY